MPKTLTIELPDEIYDGLQKLAEKWQTTPERIASDWVVYEAEQSLMTRWKKSSVLLTQVSLAGVSDTMNCWARR